MSSYAPLFPVDARAGSGFSGRDLLRLAFKHKWVMLGCFLVVTALAIYGAVRQPREFVATAQVWVKTEQQGSPSFLSGVAAYRETTLMDTPNRRIETEMAELLNRTSVENVIRKHGLRPELLKRSPLDIVLEPVLPTINRIADAAMQLLGLDKSDAASDPLATTVKTFMRSISVEPVRSKGAEVTSNVIEIKLAGTNQKLTQEALATLLAQYIERSTEREQDVARQALQALKGQTAEAYAKMTSAEDAIVSYSLRARTDADGARAVESPSAALAEAKLRTDEEALQAKLDVLLQTYGDEYAEVKTTRAALERLRARLHEQTRSSVRSNAALGVLERRRAVAETRYVELQRKLDQIDLYLKLSPTEVGGRLIPEPPRMAEKVSVAGKLLTMLAGPVVGILLGMVLSSLMEMADRRLQTRENVQAYLGVEMLAALPHMPRERRRIPETSQSILPPMSTAAGSLEAKSVVGRDDEVKTEP